MTSTPTTLVWLRRDLRLADNLALREAALAGAVVPVYIHAPDEEAPWQPGGASRWWLHHSLDALARDLAARGSRLVIRTGDTAAVLRHLLAETGATRVFWNRLHDPATVARDTAIKAALRAQGTEVRSFNAALLYEPTEIRNGSGEPYKVFTQFWKKCLATREPHAPLDAPEHLAAPGSWPASQSLESLGLLPTIAWDGGLHEAWTPGEDGARRALEIFLEGAVAGYSTDRDRPDLTGTSRLSPHLHFGEISPRQIWEATQEAVAASGRLKADATKFLAEVGWREFAHHLLFHFPATTTAPLRPEFEAFPWEHNTAWLRAWQRGRTGYPIVDAGMRELWHTGWMHNRVRMIAASFLVKDLRLHWSEGARWFWDTLVDADLASNTLGWQWTAGCGADAAPYFRVFNPVLQGAKFDPDGAYVRRWVPELARMPERFIHNPWEAPTLVLREAGVRLGDNYPEPVVDHGKARDAALAAFETIKKSAAAPGR
jgi:deoxyribodipyrimidine photo-lyase